MVKKIKLILWILIAIMLIGLIGLSVRGIYLAKTEEVVHPEVTFEIENYGTVKMELYPEYAPNTVANIIKLVENGYYTDKVIYGKDDVCLYVGRNAEGEAEDPKTSLIDSSIEAGSDRDFEYAIKGEFLANGYKENTLAHEKGVVSLMRSNYNQYFSDLTDESYNSGNAQIGILMENERNLNGIYTGFAKIIEGLEILEKIYQEAPIKVEETTEDSEATAESIDVFETYPVIKSASVDTFGNNYGMPVVQKVFDYDTYMNNYLTQYYSSQQ